MTREEAIKAIQDFIGWFKEDSLIRKALEMAIQALSQEPCGDAISREAVLDTTICEGISCNECSFNEIDGESGCLLHARIDELPPVTQKSGVWVEIDDEPHEVWECDHCGFVIDGSGCIEPYEYRDTYKFCPNCGAKMVEPQESEE